MRSSIVTAERSCLPACVRSGQPSPQPELAHQHRCLLFPLCQPSAQGRVAIDASHGHFDVEALTFVPEDFCLIDDPLEYERELGELDAEDEAERPLTTSASQSRDVAEHGVCVVPCERRGDRSRLVDWIPEHGPACLRGGAAVEADRTLIGAYLSAKTIAVNLSRGSLTR